MVWADINSAVTKIQRITSKTASTRFILMALGTNMQRQVAIGINKPLKPFLQPQSKDEDNEEAEYVSSSEDDETTRETDNKTEPNGIKEWAQTYEQFPKNQFQKRPITVASNSTNSDSKKRRSEYYNQPQYEFHYRHKVI